jgi:hypothetical protein
LQMREESLESVPRGQTCSKKGQERFVFGREFLQTFNAAGNESRKVSIEWCLYAC